MGRAYIAGPLFATVTDIKDPDNLGRVRVQLSIVGENVITDWIPIVNLYGSAKGGGAFFLPELDDQVVVGFFGDSPDSGIVLGGVWSGAQKPPESKENKGSDLNKDGKNNLKFIRSRSGHQIILDDTKGDTKVQILASGGKTRFELLEKEKRINIETDGDITISAKKKLCIEAETGELKLKKDMKVSATGLKFESKKDINMKSKAAVMVKGALIKLN
jgi:uncharacterized protein involved in type VI secretion and phage assembly